MTRDPYCVPVGTPLSEVAGQMAEHKYGSAIITNGIGQIVGIFTTTDAMRVLQKMLQSSPGDLVRWKSVRILGGPDPARWAD